MATFVLVHGAWGGSYMYGKLARALREAGHEVHVPSLTGLGERVHLAHGGITLTDHINDVVGLIDCERLEDFILVGHSYGGMVITGVAALRGARIRTLVYIDAFLPEDGQALWDIADDVARKAYIDGQRETPGLCQPFFPVGERRVSGQPLLTLLQPVKLGGEEEQIGRRTYLYATRDAPTIFTKFRDRIANDPAWTVHELATGHLVWDEDLPGVTRILLDEAGR
ncbi:MAG TPA: alpha/beta fold hydrolase [Sphingobium sp.]|nr:alpha/beta fold hydrolase [Sphingobium sp.]